MKLSHLFIVLFFLGLVVAPAIRPEAARAAADARQVMDGVYRQDTSRDTTWRAAMDTYDKKGGVRAKKFVLRKLGTLGNSRTLVRFLDPAEVRGTGLLTFNIGGERDRQWLFTPAIQRIRRIAPQERDRRFLGTDFTNEDMQERVLDDFAYKMVSENEMMDGRRCFKIEARPVAPDRSQYRMMYLWVPVDVPYTVFAQMFDRNNVLIREYHAADLVKVSGIWVAKRVEMVTKTEGTRTVMVVNDIRFNTGLKDDLFTQQALEKPDLF